MSHDIDGHRTMTDDEIHQVIVDYDRAYPPTRDIFAERRIRREAEEKERQRRQPRVRQTAATNQKSWNDWFAASFANHLSADMRRGGLLGDVIPRVLALQRQKMRDEWEPKIAALEKQVQELQQKLSLDARFAELERAIDARQAGRNASKRGAKGESGERGARGERGLQGARGPKGEPGLAVQITAWKINKGNYTAAPFYSDGTFGPALELRGLFEQFLQETSQ